MTEPVAGPAGDPDAGPDVEPSGRAGIVTAASRGIGLAIAAALVARGDRVLVTGRNPDTLESAVARLGGPQWAVGVAGKAHDEAHQDEAVARAEEAFGRVDFLVNNVGTSPVLGPLLDQTTEVIRKILDINVLAALDWTRRAHAAGMGTHGGAVVNVSSVAGLGPAPGIGAYGMSKAALSYLTRQLAMELAPQVRVNAVAPAVVKTRFAEALYADREEEVATGYPLGRLGEPDDVAGAVTYLLSDAASWVTGQVLVLDGGSTLTGNIT